MEKTIFIDDNYSKKQVVECVEELCKNGIAKGCFDMEVLIYVLGCLSQIEGMHE